MGEDSVFKSSTARRSAAIRLTLLGCCFGLLVIGIELFVPSVTDGEWLAAGLESLGWYAPLVFVALQTAQVIVAPIPGQLLAGVGGLLFGTLAGAGYSMVGVLLGSTVVFWLARRYGRTYVESVMTASALDRWDRFVRRSGVAGLFFLFLFPTFPDDLLCFVAGLSDIRLRTFLLLVGVGRAPSFLLVAYTGTEIGDGALLKAGSITLGLVLVSAACYRYREPLVTRLTG
jgi:uncharacterized membrane protein YdjX (TVP38/TMEM64 family)